MFKRKGSSRKKSSISSSNNNFNNHINKENLNSIGSNYTAMENESTFYKSSIDSKSPRSSMFSKRYSLNTLSIYNNKKYVINEDCEIFQSLNNNNNVNSNNSNNGNSNSNNNINGNNTNTINSNQSSFQFSDFLNHMYDFESNILENQCFLDQNRSPYYLEYHQNINYQMRAILLDWLIELSFELKFKRETYHLAVILLDLFLAKNIQYPTERLQLIGVTCLSLSAKFEEIKIPTMETFALSTAHAFTKDDIIKAEQEVLISLNWKICFPTLAFWGNYITYKWDEFVYEYTANNHSNNSNFNLPTFREISNNSSNNKNSNVNNIFSNKNSNYFEYLQFKSKRNDIDYNNKHTQIQNSISKSFNKKLLILFFQVVDLISIDFESYKYDSKSLLLSVLYLLIGISTNVFNIQNLVKEILNLNSYIQEQYALNSLFDAFLQSNLNISLDQIAPYINEAIFYFVMEFEIPNYKAIIESNNTNNMPMNYEETAQVQTHNKLNLKSYEKMKMFRQSVVNVNMNMNINNTNTNNTNNGVNNNNSNTTNGVNNNNNSTNIPNNKM